MSGPSDLSREVLQEHLGDRPFRTFPAILSTEAEALSWARKGAPHGALVVAGYQASPRGRSGLSFGDLFEPGHGLGFSIVLRPAGLPVAREGWLYPVTLLAVGDVLADETRLEWPDKVVRGEQGAETVAAIGIQTEPGPQTIEWAVASVLVPSVEPPRTRVLAEIADALDQRLAEPSEDVVTAFADRCRTIGRHVRARLLPLGPAAPSFLGTAVDLVEDGGLVIDEDGTDARAVVLPQELGFLEDPHDEPPPPSWAPDRG